MGGWLSRDGGAADSAAPARRGDDVADLENEEGESLSAWCAAELLPDPPRVRWQRVFATCYAAWQLKYRAAQWNAQSTLQISAHLFGPSSEFVADADAVAEGVGRVVPSNPAGRSVEGDFRRSADAYSLAWKAFVNAGSGGGAAAAKALAVSVRDVVAWRCVRLVGAESEDAYMAALDSAFAGGVNSDKRLRSQRLISFHVVIGGGRHARNINASQRRRRRPRKSRSSPRGIAPVSDRVRSGRGNGTS